MQTAPGYTQWIPVPVGQFRKVLADPLSFQLDAQKRFGDIVRFRIGPLVVHFLYHPDHVRHVLFDHQKNYLRGWQYHVLRNLFGNNLVVAEGDFWRRQRRLAQPAFHRQRIAAYASSMVKATVEMLKRWNSQLPAIQSVDIGNEMSRVALTIAGQTLFNQDLSHKADAVGQTFTTVSKYLDHRLNRPFSTPPSWVPTPANRHFRRAASRLNAIVLALIQERRKDSIDHGDLLSMLMQASDEETGEVMTDNEIRSEVLVFLIAGHETTATALTWTCCLLAAHQQIQDRVRNEILLAVGERLPTMPDLANMPLTRMVIEESMRLYPPIWALPRQAVRDDEIDGYKIPAGSTIVLSQYVTHRHPMIWHEPESFDPERFTVEQNSTRPKGAYFPFLGGPHLCIGNEFAMLEMRLVLATILQQFEFNLPPERDIRPIASLTLRPSRPVHLTIRNV